jgi:HAD superfamily 5'-nucleotidase-like hydrolase
LNDEAAGIAPNERIFTTRTLNLNSIKVIGFDMDYTLVVYKDEVLEDLIYRLTVKRLVEKMGYPKEIRDLRFDPKRVIRGLVIDKKLGNLLKINLFGYIKAALHGDHFYTREDLREIYSDDIVTFPSDRFEMIHTLFALALSSLFCQITALEIGTLTYEKIYEDLISTINDLHQHGPVKEAILKEPEMFIYIDKSYLETVQMLKSFGKKLLLITNSDWSYMRSIMPICFDPFLPAGTTWRDLFDLVVVDAMKPGFFTGQNSYYEVITEDGHLVKTDELQPKRVYQGGNAVAIESLFNVSRGQILYVGDHIYSDVYQSKKACHWRTMLVISELEKELQAASNADPALKEIKEHMRVKEELELNLDKIKKQSSGKEDSADLQKAEEEVRKKIQEVDAKVGLLIEKLNSHFNPNWGELLFAGNDKSYFFMSIERYACTYTSKVSNLLNYSPAHYFRPPIKSYEIA